MYSEFTRETVTIYLHGERGPCGFEISSIRIPEDQLSVCAHVHAGGVSKFCHTSNIHVADKLLLPDRLVVALHNAFQFSVENFFPLFSPSFFGNSPSARGMEWRINLDMAAVPQCGISLEKNSMRVLHTVPNT